MADGIHGSASIENAIMTPTDRVLYPSGYTETRIARIAEKFPERTSPLSYHYETKDELFAGFLADSLDISRDNAPGRRVRFAGRGPQVDRKGAPTEMDEVYIQRSSPCSRCMSGHPTRRPPGNSSSELINCCSGVTMSTRDRHRMRGLSRGDHRRDGHRDADDSLQDGRTATHYWEGE